MYRTIDAAFWTDPKVRQLTPQAKLIFLYLVTNPHGHLSGIYYLPAEVVAKETGYHVDTLSGWYLELISKEIIMVDAENDVFWVKNMLRHQGKGKKVLASAINQLKNLHNSPLVDNFREYYRIGKKPKSGYPIGVVSEAGCDSRKEQEQEKEEKNNTATAISEKRFTKPSIDDVRAYCLERNNGIDADAWLDHYESNGWRVGKTPMKNWKAAVRNWERNQTPSQVRVVSARPGMPLTDEEIANGTWNPITGYKRKA